MKLELKKWCGSIFATYFFINLLSKLIQQAVVSQMMKLTVVNMIDFESTCLKQLAINNILQTDNAITN